MASQHPWAWFSEKVLPSLFIALSVAVGGSLWANYNAVRDLTSEVRYHDRQIAELKAEIVAVKENSITRAESLETLKRVEQQLEIVLLRAGVKSGAVRLTGGER